MSNQLHLVSIMSSDFDMWYFLLDNDDISNLDPADPWKLVSGFDVGIEFDLLVHVFKYLNDNSITLGQEFTGMAY